MTEKDAPPVECTRRLRLFPLVMAALGLAAIEAFWWEPVRVGVNRWTIPLRTLPPALDGLTIAQVSDFHVHARGWRPAVTRRALDIAQSLYTDMIVLVGDFVDANVGAPLLVDLFGGLHAPLGVYAVLGNHDYYGNTRRPALVSRALNEAGVTMLHNRAVPIERDGGRLWLGGVEDGRLHHARPDDVLASIPAAERPRLLLSHYPDLVDHLHPGDWDLVLCGHTHGGQINIPLLASLAIRTQADSRYLQGLYHIHGLPMLISRGVGTIGLPGRLFAPPQVNLIRLIRPAQI